MARVYQTNDGFTKTLSGMTGRFQTWQLWADFVQMASITISQTVDYREEREKSYLEISNKYSQDEMTKFVHLLTLTAEAFEENRDQDYLGSLYMGLDLGSHWHGQFFTPYNICKAMAMMSVGSALEEIESKGFVTMNDCACGAGATLIAGTNQVCEALRERNSPLNYQNHVLAVAQDIDPITAGMCYIQLSLLGVAGVVCVGDSLLHPFVWEGLDAPREPNLWFTPMYFSDVWTGRRLARRLDSLIFGGAR